MIRFQQLGSRRLEALVQDSEVLVTIQQYPGYYEVATLHPVLFGGKEQVAKAWVGNRRDARKAARYLAALYPGTH